MLICLNGTEYVYGQWTEKDSVWLQKVISGKEKIELNPEALKAIESGTLINTDKPASNMIMAPSTSPASCVLKDFSEYVRLLPFSCAMDSTSPYPGSKCSVPSTSPPISGLTLKNLQASHSTICFNKFLCLAHAPKEEMHNAGKHRNTTTIIRNFFIHLLPHLRGCLSFYV